MNKKETLNKINKDIDTLIIKGKTNTPEYKKLEKMHYILVMEMGFVK